jgi:hypothetical protein
MKRIIKEDQEVVSLYDINNTSCVGIQWESGDKCFIINTPEGFCSVSNRNRPNIFNVWYVESAQEYVRRALNQGNNTNSKAFIFDDQLELYKWMSKQ